MITLQNDAQTEFGTCRRCLQRKILRYMVPLFDTKGFWDGVTYREWCLSCWARRRGAHPADGTVEFYIPRDRRTQRFDRAVMKHRDSLSDEALIAACPPEQGRSPLAFITELSKQRRVDFKLSPIEAATADDILNASKHERFSAATPQQHLCSFDSIQRPIYPDTRCDYCGQSIEEISNV